MLRTRPRLERASKTQANARLRLPSELTEEQIIALERGEWDESIAGPQKAESVNVGTLRAAMDASLGNLTAVETPDQPRSSNVNSDGAIEKSSAAAILSLDGPSLITRRNAAQEKDQLGLPSTVGDQAGMTGDVLIQDLKQIPTKSNAPTESQAHEQDDDGGGCSVADRILINGSIKRFLEEHDLSICKKVWEKGWNGGLDWSQVDASNIHQVVEKVMQCYDVEGDNEYMRNLINTTVESLVRELRSRPDEVPAWKKFTDGIQDEPQKSTAISQIGSKELAGSGRPDQIRAPERRILWDEIYYFMKYPPPF